MNNLPIRLLALLYCLVPTQAVSGVITSATDSRLDDTAQVNFDNLPLGYIKDSASDSTLSINGVTFTADSLTVNNVTFTNGGDTHWFASGTDIDNPNAQKTVEIEGLSVNDGADAWWFGRGPEIAPLPNKVLLQRTFESRTSVIDLPGRLNVIKIEFIQPVTAFGLIVGGNQPGQTLEVYDTDNQLIETISRPTEIANYFTGYARNSFMDNRIKYLLWGNINSHDRLYIDSLRYETRSEIIKQYFYILVGCLILVITVTISYRNRIRNALNNI